MINVQERFSQEVYPFTNEMISGYFPKLDLGGKSLLTVGSSCDQAFNALVLGAKNVTVYDINPSVRYFYKLKRDFILKFPRKELISKVMGVEDFRLSKDVFGDRGIIKMNNYLQSDDNYELLREKLQEKSIFFIEGDILDMKSSLGSKRFDRIVFSNVLQYFSRRDPYNFFKKYFDDWKNHLNEDGILQLLYLYAFPRVDFENRLDYEKCSYLDKIFSSVKSDSLSIDWFWDSNLEEQDAIVTYTKKRR